MSETKRIRKRAPSVFGTVIAVAIALLITFFSPNLIRAQAQDTSGAVDYYKATETADLNKQIDALSKGYGSYMDNYKASAKGAGADVSIKAIFGQGLLKLLGTEDLKSIEASVLSMQTDKKSKSIISLAANDQTFTTLNMLMDTDKELAYILIPELSKAYLKLSTNPYDELSGSMAFTPFTAKQLTDFLNNNPLTEELLNKLLKKYTSIVINEVNDVTVAGSDKVIAGNVSANYTKLIVKIDEETALSIGEKVLTTAKEDKDLLNLLVAFKLCSKSEYNSRIQETLDFIEKKKADIPEDGTGKEAVLTMNVYVDDKGNITGRDFSFEDNSEKINTLSFGYKTAKKDSDIGFDAWFTENGKDDFNLSGKVNAAETGVSGDITFTYNDPYSERPEDIHIKLEDVKYTADGVGGYLNGSFKLTGDSLSGLSIGAEYSGNTEQQTMKMDFDQSGEKLLSLIVKAKSIPYVDFKLPSKSAQIYDAETQITEYLSTADLNGYLKGINSNINVKAINDYLALLIE